MGDVQRLLSASVDRVADRPLVLIPSLFPSKTFCGMMQRCIQRPAGEQGPSWDTATWLEQSTRLRYLLQYSLLGKACLPSLSQSHSCVSTTFRASLIPDDIRLTTEEVTLWTRVDIRNRANHRVIDIHDSEVCQIGCVVSRPVRLRCASEALRIRIKIYSERGIPVLHDERECGIVNCYFSMSASVPSSNTLYGSEVKSFYQHTGRIGAVQEGPSCTMQLSSSIENELISRLSPVAYCLCHVVCHAICLSR